MRFLLFLLAVIPFVTCAQTRKLPPVIYKTTASSVFKPKDRIAIGSFTFESVAGKYRKYRVHVPASFAGVRDFVFAHPEMEYRIVVTWRQTGRKFPSLTDAVTDTLMNYFRKPASSPDNRLYMNEIYHAFAKTEENVTVDLEILTVNRSPLLAASNGNSPFLLPEAHVLYRNYRNEILIDTTHLQPGGALWLESPKLVLKYQDKGKAVAQFTRKREEINARIYTTHKKLADKVSHGIYYFEVRELPPPDLFLDSVKLSEVKASQLKKGAQFNAFYADGSFPSSEFSVVEIILEIGGKAVKINGGTITAKAEKAIAAAPEGSVIILKKIAVNGNRRCKYYDLQEFKK